MCATLSADEVYTKNKKGNELYKKEKYEDALKEYEDALLIAPADTALKMNRGSALYNLGRLGEAESTYTAALSIGDKKKKADAHYNLGDIFIREGDQLMQGGGQGAAGAQDKYKAALQHYITALDMRPKDKDAKWNIELTQKRIKMAQQQQQQQNQDKQDKQDKNKDNKQNQNNQDKKQNQDSQDKNKDNQDKDKKQDQDKKQNQDNQDKNKDNQDKDKNQNAQNDKQKQQEQQPQPQPQDKKEDMQKKEAERIIMQFADDADTLNKPPKKEGLGLKLHKPEKDW